MTSIRTTVQQSMQRAGLGGYFQRADAVITALQERENRAIQSIRRAAERAGLSRTNVDQVIREAGLEESAAQSQNQSSNSNLESRVRGLEERLARAENAARRHGVTI